MENNNKNKPIHEGFDMVKMPDGKIVNVKSEKSLFPHTQGLSNLVSTSAQEDNPLE